jgi:short-subunit dehydrogenase
MPINNCLFIASKFAVIGMSGILMKEVRKTTIEFAL